jgi:hypothetical protein
MSSPGVWPPGVSNIFTNESVEDQICEFMQTINLRSLRDLSQSLDQEVEGWHKHFDSYHSKEVERLDS